MTTTHKTLRGPRGALIFAKKEDNVANRIRAAVNEMTDGKPDYNQMLSLATALNDVA
jgi:glycine/serine hydroxymethyltransferase